MIPARVAGRKALLKLAERQRLLFNVLLFMLLAIAVGSTVLTNIRIQDTSQRKYPEVTQHVGSSVISNIHQHDDESHRTSTEVTEAVVAPQHVQRESSVFPQSVKKHKTMREEKRCGGAMPMLCLFHIFNIDDESGTRNRITVLTSILAQPGRCDKIRFYVGEKVPAAKVQEMIPPEYANIALAVDTESLGPWRDRGPYYNKKRGNFVPGYANRFEHTYRSFYHLNEVEGDDLDWIVKLDLDTVFFPENFRKFLDEKGFCSTDPYYLGHAVQFRVVHFAAGAINILSRAALQKLADSLKTNLMPKPTAWPYSRTNRECLDIETQSEDYHIAVCLSVAGVIINATNNRDSENREYFQIYTAPAHYRGLRFGKMWFWDGKGFTKETANDREKCCALYPVNFHKYSDLKVWQEIYEGKDARLPSGDFDTERLQLHAVLDAHDRVARGQYTVKEAPPTDIVRVHFPPPPSPSSPDTASSASPSPSGASSDCVVRVGWCEGAHLSSGNPDEGHASALAHATFPKCRVEMVKLNQDGTARGPGVPPGTVPAVDIMFCLGWFYHESVLETRVAARNRTAAGPPHPRADGTPKWQGGVLWPELAEVVPHERGRPFLAAYNNEPWAASGRCLNTRKTASRLRAYDVMFDTKLGTAPGNRCSNIPSIYLPVGVHAMYTAENRETFFRANASFTDLVASTPPAEVVKRKPKFCAFLVRHCDKSFYKAEAGLRAALFDELGAQFKACEALGHCRTAREARAQEHRFGAVGSTMDMLRDYRFVIAFENTWMPGYISERLPQALLTDTIPVYFGHNPTAARQVNMERVVAFPFMFERRINKFRDAHQRFVEANPMARVEAAKVEFKAEIKQTVDRIRAIETDPAEYRRLLSLPRLPGNKLEGTVFDIKTIAGSLQSVLRTYKSYLVEAF